jgi:glucose-6-phosphate isomerase/transaldolase/glucose-6-phosphate isomerase
MSLQLNAKLPASFQSVVHPALDGLTRERVIERLWSKDHRLWKPDPKEIADRLGWLTVQDQMRQQLGQLQRCVAAAKDLKMKDVVLLGMGGSSLGPEVFRTLFGSQKGFPRLWVLDSTIPGWIRQVTKAISPSRTLFLVASKSGGTIEVMSLFAHFWNLVAKAKGNRGGKQFVAITDPGTGLEKMAREYGFGDIFTNPADIGGRYSVLSLFGLVPAAFLGLDIAKLLDRAAGMAERCRQQHDIATNPGAYLGVAVHVRTLGGTTACGKHGERGDRSHPDRTGTDAEARRLWNRPLLRVSQTQGRQESPARSSRSRAHQGWTPGPSVRSP